MNFEEYEIGDADHQARHEEQHFRAQADVYVLRAAVAQRPGQVRALGQSEVL